MDGGPTAEELENLYSSLSSEDRDQLVQELLVASTHGGEAMVAVVDAWLVEAAGRAFIDGLE